MKSLLLSLLLIAAVGCTEKADDNGTKIVEGIQIVVMDGCQYVVYTSYKEGAGIVHHANCRNPIHQQKSQTP